jgi:hypothetical protein
MRIQLDAIILLVLATLTFSACVIASRHFTYRESVEISEESLRLDGYYFQKDTRKKGDPDSSFPGYTGTTIRPVVLWRDGTAAFTSAWRGKILSSEKYEATRYGTLREAQKKFESKIDSLISGKKKTSGWGAFRVRDDSISIQVMMEGGGGRPFQFFPVEHNGVILNDTTFVLTEFVYHVSPYEGTHSQSDTFHFKKFEDKPNSSNWTQSHSKLQ